MGCIARLGCLMLLVILGVGAWFTRNLWLPERYRAHAVASAPSAVWQPVTDAGAQRAKVALDKLSQPTGQAFQTMSASDLASYAFKALGPEIASSADSISTRVSGQSVSMRAVIRTAELQRTGVLGPIGDVLNAREPVEMTGTFTVLHPGLAEFNVQELSLRGVSVPKAAIPTLIKQVSRNRPAGVSPNSLPLPIPRSVGDIRIANGKVTLYKSVQ